MQDNTSGRENEGGDDKNGTKTGQKRDRPEKVKHPKTSLEYWKTAVTFRPGVANGLYYVRLRAGLKDAWICLDSSNRIEAAGKARGFWLRMKSLGSLDALLKELNPAPDPRLKDFATVAEAISASAAVAGVRPVSFAAYAMKLRTLAGEVAGISKPALATSRSAPDAMRWREAVGRVSLALLTREAIEAWRKARIDAAGDPLQSRSARISADATIRMARSVFSKRALAAKLGERIRLPESLGLTQVSTGKSFVKFQSAVDPFALFAAARSELETQRPEVFLALVLGLCVALRRSEADRLRWEQVDFRHGMVTIETTVAHAPKTEDSARKIRLAPDVAEILRRASTAPDRDPHFVLRGGAPKEKIGAAPAYRADMAPYHTWETLLKWLRIHGVTNRKPAHALRALAASNVRDRLGIAAASELLGHANIKTTVDSYSAPSAATVSFAPDAPAKPETTPRTP